MNYPLKIERDDNGAFLITSPAFPEVTSFAETEGDIEHYGLNAIEEAIAARIDDGKDIPAPSPRKRGRMVRLPLLTTLKVELYNALRSEGLTRAELARRLHWHREQVDGLFRLDHNSRRPDRGSFSSPPPRCRNPGQGARLSGEERRARM